MKLLIVEDERALPDNMLAYRSRGDLVCEQAATFREAQDKLLSFAYDIVVLDILLPDGNGFQFTISINSRPSVA